MPTPFKPPLSLNEISPLFPNIVNLEALSSGGEGSVFKGFCTNVNKLVAIKIYSPDRLRRRSELEVNKLKQASCEYLVSLVDYGNIMVRGLECFFITTDFIEGNTLKELFEKQYRFNSEEVIRLIKCIGKAIDSLWQLKVVHCDITPKNIIKKQNGHYVLIDLGIAKHIDAETLTKYGIIYGTPGYIAPEQIHGRKNLTLRADFYSLGIVAYQALTGQHPFNYRQDIMFKHPIPPIPDALLVNPNLKKVIYAMTQLLAYKRPSSYKEILGLLGEA